MRRAVLILGFSVLVLITAGIVVLASASPAYSARANGGDTYYCFVHQWIWLAVGLVAGLVATLFNYRKWREYLWLTWLLLITMMVFLAVLAVAAKVPSVATALHIKAVNGSFRWFTIPSVGRIQPAEFAKIALVIFTAAWIDSCRRLELFWKGVIPIAGIIGAIGALLLCEPDLGSTFVIGITCVVMFMVGGVRWLHIGYLALMAIPVGLYWLVHDANRMRRIIVWLPDSWATALIDMLHLGNAVSDSAKLKNVEQQLNMALVAIKRGGIFGVGYNESMQKERYLPEGHTDFIFAIGAEEFGLIFSLLLLAFFVTFFICGLYIARKASDRFGRLLAYGAVFLIFFQAMFNVGVVTGVMPTKGLALPFVSYGGTNLVAALIAVGILINVGWRGDRLNKHIKSTISSVIIN